MSLREDDTLHVSAHRLAASTVPRHDADKGVLKILCLSLLERTCPVGITKVRKRRHELNSRLRGGVFHSRKLAKQCCLLPLAMGVYLGV